MRTRMRGAIIVGTMGAIGVVAVLSTSASRTRGVTPRAPISRAQAAPDPVDRVIRGVRYLTFDGAPEELLPDSVAPTTPAALLWLDGRRTARTTDGAVALDAAGGVVAIDLALRPHQLPVHGEGREWLSVAAGPWHGLWLTDATGALFFADSGGHLRQSTASPFTYAEVATDPRLGTPWLVRSWHRFGYGIPPESSPVIERRDAAGVAQGSLGRARRPEHVLLADLANAGTVAVTKGAVYFAPFIRDELVAMTLTGDTLWVVARGLLQSTPEPKFELKDGKAVVAYHPVNLGLTIGPDGLLYLLSTPGKTTLRSRLDVFDPVSGRLRRSAAFTTATPTLAADAKGRVYVLDPFQVMAGVAPRQREAIPDVELPALNRGVVSLPSQHGRVLLLNLWASWCKPCREEMPALDSLQRDLDGPQFAFIGLNDDVDVAAARRFVEERGFDFTVALGRGRVKDLFHAPGLPVTVLVDREGREVHRWLGFSGPDQIDAIRAMARAEIDRFPPMSAMHHH